MCLGGQRVGWVLIVCRLIYKLPRVSTMSRVTLIMRRLPHPTIHTLQSAERSLLYIHYLISQPDIFLPRRFDLYQRPSSEEACSVLLPVLATVVMWRSKKPISCHITSLPWQELEQELNKLLPTKVADGDRNVEVKICEVETWSSVYINVLLT